MLDIQIVVIDDTPKIKDDTLIWELEAKFGNDNVKVINEPETGLEHIKANLDKNLIILLDIDFPANERNGHALLKEITGDISRLIPVILWSGVDENKERFSDFINNGAFGFISKMATTEEAFKIIEKAEKYFKTSLDNTIEDWIIQNDENKDKPVYFTAEGKSYSLNDILKEIRHQSDIGKSFAKKLTNLTIDLLLRNKENLND